METNTLITDVVAFTSESAKPFAFSLRKLAEKLLHKSLPIILLSYPTLLFPSTLEMERDFYF